MGTSRTMGQLATKLERVSVAMTGARRPGVERAAFATKQALLDAEGAPRFLKNVGRRGAKVGVRYDIKGSENPTALVRWYGPVHLVNNPTRRHEITPKVRRRKARKAVLVNGTPRARADHPGTRGKRFFEKGAARAATIAPAEYWKATTDAVARVVG